MITIPTTELIGGINDVLPVITDPKSATAGIVVEWDGEALSFTAYDVYSAATVRWLPGDGAEGEIGDDDQDEIDWGGDDNPWRTWIWLDSAKEILKIFKLPAKLWRVPVTLKCSPTGDRLIVEREDGPVGERLLTIPGDHGKAIREVPDVRKQAEAADAVRAPRTGIGFSPNRLGALCATVRPHGTLAMAFAEGLDEPVGIQIGTRYAAWIYTAGARNVRPYNALRDGTGVMTGV